MSDYKITKTQFEKAKKLNVIIKPSSNKNKKIDIFDKNNKKIFSIGDIKYLDYELYIKKKGLDYAKTRRRLYKIRHNKYRHKIFSKSFYADQILW